MSECRGKLQASVRDKGIVKTKVFKDMGKKKLGNASSINVFGTGSEDYPLHKAVVDHDHQGIMAGGWGKISDEVNEELLEWEG